MAVKIVNITIPTQGPNAYPITDLIQEAVNGSEISTGTVTIFCKHISCSLMIMENADPSVWQDLQNYMNRLVPTNFPGFTHKTEGPDDMPAHVKTALTNTSETIPFVEGKLCLGTWQGIFLWEFRNRQFRRDIVLCIMGE